MPAADGSFAFLFRTDRGRIDRATWWRGTVPLALIGAAGDRRLARGPSPTLTTPSISRLRLAVLGYVYLLVFTFATLLLFICEYNLSAKRFAARGRAAGACGRAAR